MPDNPLNLVDDVSEGGESGLLGVQKGGAKIRGFSCLLFFKN